MWERDFYDFMLGSLRKAPGMYIGKKNIYNLGTFICGYCIATRIHRVEMKPDFFGSFYQFLKGKFKSDNTEWTGILAEITDGDELRAVDLFFTELELFYNSAH
ncbi:MAG: hypothetical protein KDC92_12620 [Bacteroidetes bacterium]|nr:hypothetical protein [Bacteroidota bacterium]